MTLSSRAVTLAIALAAVGCAARTSPVTTFSAPNNEEIRQQVAANLATDARAWNAGDLDAFLSAYVPDASFVTSRGVLHGTTAIRGVYAARFAPGAKRDSLHFENLEVDVLAPDRINAIAYYVLMKGDSVTSRGPTSLVMRWSNGRWRIAHDHSS